MKIWIGYGLLLKLSAPETILINVGSFPIRDCKPVLKHSYLAVYPPGNVYNVQWQTVFVSEAVDDPNSKAHASLRREGRRVILRHVQDVTARFSEPVFGRSMFGGKVFYQECASIVSDGLADHNPANYEAAMDTLYVLVI